MGRINAEYIDDYVQSANSLFHFMKNEEYLLYALMKCALMPRYCRENIEYMGLKDPNDKPIKEILVLQKCFCDIPFHKLFEKFPVNIVNDKVHAEEDRKRIINNEENTHIGCYGGYGIVFSKAWCVSKGLQPVLYVNENSECLRQLKEVYNQVMKQDDVEDVYVESLLSQLSYLKPLQGIMSRYIDGRNVDMVKNFHDEMEWRFIPKDEYLKDVQLDKVAIKKVLVDKFIYISNNIETQTYEKLWLKFMYEDIKYIIVPDQTARENVIRFILEEIDDSVELMRKSVLISKIQVLADIRKDW